MPKSKTPQANVPHPTNGPLEATASVAAGGNLPLDIIAPRGVGEYVHRALSTRDRTIRNLPPHGRGPRRGHSGCGGALIF